MKLSSYHIGIFHFLIMNASYFSAKIGDKEAKNIAWTYPFPSTEVLKIKDMICLYAERLDELIIDGEIQPAPQLIGDF